SQPVGLRMDWTSAPVRTGQILVAALLAGMVSFSGVGVAMAGQLGGKPDPKLADLLFVVMGILAIGELGVYHLLLRPMFLRPVRREAAAREERIRAAFIEQRYLGLTILAAALAEGVGLLGAVTVLMTGRFEALASPALATVVLLLILPTRDRF